MEDYINRNGWNPPLKKIRRRQGSSCFSDFDDWSRGDKCYEPTGREKWYKERSKYCGHCHKGNHHERILNNHCNVNNILSLIGSLHNSMSVEYEEDGSQGSPSGSEEMNHVFKPTETSPPPTTSNMSTSPDSPWGQGSSNSIYYCGNMNEAAESIYKYGEHVKKEAMKAYLENCPDFDVDTLKYDEKKLNQPNTSDNSLCCICMENEKCIALKPCHHLVMCGACAEVMIKDQLQKNNSMQIQCPLCRTTSTLLTSVKFT